MGGAVEYAPAAIRALFDAIQKAIPQAQLSGIVGDAMHAYGYHRCRNVLSSRDYSVGQSPLDRQGDGWAASALDVSLPPSLMVAVSKRLMTAARARDPRLKAVREWFGTVNGTTVTGWDLFANAATTSDDSHLWHVHLSFYRAYATDAKALAPIADVFTGATKEDDVSQADVIAALKSPDGRAAVQAAVAGTLIRNPITGTDVPLATFVQSINSGVYDLRLNRITKADVAAAVAAAAPGVDAAKVTDSIIANLAKRLENA